MQEHLYLGRSHWQSVLNNPSWHLLEDSREPVPRRERTALLKTGIFPQLDSSHCQFQVQELPLGTEFTVSQSRLLLDTGIAIFASSRFSQVLPVPTGHGLWLHFLPEKNDQTEEMDADLYFVRQELYLRTDCPYSVIVSSQDTRSVHGTFLLLVLPDQYVGRCLEVCIPNVLESNDVELHQHYNRLQLELNFQEAKIICTLNK